MSSGQASSVVLAWAQFHVAIAHLVTLKSPCDEVYKGDLSEMEPTVNGCCMSCAGMHMIY